MISDTPFGSGDISLLAKIHPTTKIWRNVSIRENAQIDENCIIGQGAYIGVGVKIGRNCKIQNNALIYEPAIIEDGVFIGPAVVLTNDHFPRAVNSDGTIKSSSDWSATGVLVRIGASIGANSVCVAPVIIGEWSMIGSGSVVTKDVPPHALIVGNPTRQIGWVGKSGQKLISLSDVLWQCPKTKSKYQIDQDGKMSAI
jgi:acetyltransferase-like isoleucine patch superfamily enzyme